LMPAVTEVLGIPTTAIGLVIVTDKKSGNCSLEEMHPGNPGGLDRSSRAF
jgi:hypothetical protein